jgi:hypothetical protein
MHACLRINCQASKLHIILTAWVCDTEQTKKKVSQRKVDLHHPPGAFVVSWLHPHRWQCHDLDCILLSSAAFCGELHNGKACKNNQARTYNKVPSLYAQGLAALLKLLLTAGDMHICCP